MRYTGKQVKEVSYSLVVAAPRLLGYEYAELVGQIVDDLYSGWDDELACGSNGWMSTFF